MSGFGEYLKRLRSEQSNSVSSPKLNALKIYDESQKEDICKYYTVIRKVDKSFTSFEESSTYLNKLVKGSTGEDHLKSIFTEILAIIRFGKDPESVMKLLDQILFGIAIDIINPAPAGGTNVQISPFNLDSKRIFGICI